MSLDQTVDLACPNTYTNTPFNPSHSCHHNDVDKYFWISFIKGLSKNKGITLSMGKPRGKHGTKIWKYEVNTRDYWPNILDQSQFYIKSLFYYIFLKR